MSIDDDKRFDVVLTANVTYTLTESDLKFLNEGQPIHVIVSSGSSHNCSLILLSPKPKENK